MLHNGVGVGQDRVGDDVGFIVFIWELNDGVRVTIVLLVQSLVQF